MGKRNRDWRLIRPDGSEVVSDHPYDLFLQLRQEVEPVSIPYTQGEWNGSFTLFGLASALMRDPDAREEIVEAVGKEWAGD